MNEKRYTVLDLFCGCGGMSTGFESAGYDILLGIDIWKDALITFQNNHRNSRILCADISNISGNDVENIIGNNTIDVIIGGPPCQGFSIAGKRMLDDERNKLYKGFVRMVAYFKPRAFVLENVPNIFSIGNGIIKENIIQEFENLGYNVSTKILIASDYGVPQNRRRAIFIGLRNGIFNFEELPTVDHKVSTAEAIDDLPEISLPDGNPYTIKPNSEFQTLIREKSCGIWNHQTTNHNEQTTKIIALVPDGGNYKDLPANLQNTRKVHIAWTRLNSKKPSITIDTGHRHHFHYKWNRIPTVRECARIQSFPDNYIFSCSKTSQYKQVGNAVPPIMAQAIANHLKKLL